MMINELEEYTVGTIVEQLHYSKQQNQKIAITFIIKFVNNISIEMIEYFLIAPHRCKQGF